MSRKKEKKQFTGVAGSGLTQKELKKLEKNLKLKKFLKNISGAKAASRLQDEFDMDKTPIPPALDDMKMPPDKRSDEQKFKDFQKSLLAKGGEVKKYMGGGSVHKKKNKMITTRGWGASRKT